MPSAGDLGAPPGPGERSAALALRWVADPYGLLQECGALYGDVFSLDLGPHRYVLFSNPDAVRTIFAAGADVLRVGPGNGVLLPFFGPASLLLLEGDAHARERRLLMPAFHPRVIAGYAELVRTAIESATRDWSVGHSFDAHEVFQGVSLDVILRAVFGLRPGAVFDELKRELGSFLNDRRFALGLLDELGGSAVSGLSTLRERLRAIGDRTKAFVKERRAVGAKHEGEPDMLSLLLEARDEDGHGRSDDELRDELLTLVATGHETTATGLAWGLYWLASEEGVRRRLREELGPDAPDLGSAERLPYLDAVCKETLRIHPVVPAVFRQAVQPCSVGGYRFEAGAVLCPNILGVHRRADLYSDPERFEPARFLSRTYGPNEYLPFGGGVRRCIGMALAMFEMKLILAYLVRRFELGVRGRQVVPSRRSVTVAPSGGPRMMVEGVRA